MGQRAKIQAVRKTIEVTPQGDMKEVYLISFTSPRGAELFIRIPADGGDLSNARALIEEESRRVDKIYGEET